MKTSKRSELKTEKLFQLHFFLWRILGNLPTKNYRQLYNLYSILVNIFITIGYPLHLVIGFFGSTSMFYITKNLAIVLTCLCCSLKTCLIWFKFKNVHKMLRIIERQEKRISQSKDEALYYKTAVFPAARKIMILFKILSVAASLTGEMAVLTKGFFGHWDLMYPGYFPFDLTANSWNYALAHAYQYFGISFQILQNLINDTFAGMHLALLSGQAHILGMRVAHIGHNRATTNLDNNQQLLACIQDHMDLLEYRYQLEEVITHYMFLQILFTSINMCVTIVFMLLFVRDPITLTHYVIYLICMMAQIFPSCYYGTAMEFEFQNLTHALFSTNWMDQDKSFKRNLQIFAEQTKKPIYLMAWLVRINMHTFLTACKNAYSLFALVMSLK